jgi:hypothetical protein
MHATITFTDITQPVLDLYTLLTAASTPGYTVQQSRSALQPTISTVARVSYLSVQASPRNAGSQYVYKGGPDLGNAGSSQGKELAAGIIDTIQGIYDEVHLSQV